MSKKAKAVKFSLLLSTDSEGIKYTIDGSIEPTFLQMLKEANDDVRRVLQSEFINSFELWVSNLFSKVDELECPTATVKTNRKYAWIKPGVMVKYRSAQGFVTAEVLSAPVKHKGVWHVEVKNERGEQGYAPCKGLKSNG